MQNLATRYLSLVGNWMNTTYQESVTRWVTAISEMEAQAYTFERWMEDTAAFWTHLTNWSMIPAQAGLLPRAFLYLPQRGGEHSFNPVPAEDPSNRAPTLRSFFEISSTTPFPNPNERIQFNLGTNSVTIQIRLQPLPNIPNVDAGNLPNGHYMGLLTQDLGAPAVTTPIAIVHLIVEAN